MVFYVTEKIRFMAVDMHTVSLFHGNAYTYFDNLDMKSPQCSM